MPEANKIFAGRVACSSGINAHVNELPNTNKNSLSSGTEIILSRRWFTLLSKLSNSTKSLISVSVAGKWFIDRA